MKYPIYEYIIMAVPILLGIIGGYFVCRHDWKRYGSVYLISGVIGNALCWAFAYMKLYAFPDRPFHGQVIIPLMVMFTWVPYTVVAGIRYSPVKWGWKIPFYWAMVHIAVVSEIALLENTRIFRLTFGWDLWDSYTWWWLFYVFFEWIGGRIVRSSDRKPIRGIQFRYGRWGWLVFHFIVISTVFVYGMYVGKTVWGK
ncbi:hypothetical protein FHS18_003829 [Paenibacillus phyllosphaerae]|uniref:Uncharacterized protein n=1 Tax=Paenibacillus phyllosphaerae TaxID=274593 RepID=A0A7W5FNX1_9BACL|nr:CBO0543 family protein [Paenibacillus phyllosphaerae]MBB3111761.1 hypothetical protein [Paenibacillus phyllosphaerae]